MKQKSYDRVFVPFTTKMTSLERLYNDTLIEEIQEYVFITKEWLQTNDGLEYIRTQKSSIKSLTNRLKQHHIKTTTLNNLLLTQYSIGRSYAHKSINKDSTQDLTIHDEKSIKKLLKGVNKIINRFEKTIIKDLKHFINTNRGETVQAIINKLKDWMNHNYTTLISAKTRAEMIARTEMQRSFNNGVLQTYSNYGLNSFDIVNYNDIGICDKCIDLIMNNPYTLEEVMMLLPVHPHCRCLCVIAHTNTEVPLSMVENPMIIDMFKLT